MAELPEELRQMIFEYLPFKEVLQLSYTCRHYHRWVNSNWPKLRKRHFAEFEIKEQKNGMLEIRMSPSILPAYEDRSWQFQFERDAQVGPCSYVEMVAIDDVMNDLAGFGLRQDDYSYEFPYKRYGTDDVMKLFQQFMTNISKKLSFHKISLTDLSADIAAVILVNFHAHNTYVFDLDIVYSVDRGFAEPFELINMLRPIRIAFCFPKNTANENLPKLYALPAFQKATTISVTGMAYTSDNSFEVLPSVLPIPLNALEFVATRSRITLHDIVLVIKEWLNGTRTINGYELALLRPPDLPAVERGFQADAHYKYIAESLHAYEHMCTIDIQTIHMLITKSDGSELDVISHGWNSTFTLSCLRPSTISLEKRACHMCQANPEYQIVDQLLL